jgi:hypothetical protein
MSQTSIHRPLPPAERPVQRRAASRGARSGCVYTIGHGNRSLETFTTLLRAARVGCIIDVRAYPGLEAAPAIRPQCPRSLARRSEAPGSLSPPG